MQVRLSPKQLVDDLDAAFLEDRDDSAFQRGNESDLLSLDSNVPRRDGKREHYRSKSVEDIIQM